MNSRSRKGEAALDDDGKSADAGSGVRLDKWLWAARFYKTRSLAAEEVGRGRVLVNEQFAKAGRMLRNGDRLTLRQGQCPVARVVIVRSLSDVRGPAPVARLLYEETAESLAAIAQWQSSRAYTEDPARSITQGRPTKADRRQIAQWQRWSVSLDDES